MNYFVLSFLVLSLLATTSCRTTNYANEDDHSLSMNEIRGIRRDVTINGVTDEFGFGLRLNVASYWIYPSKEHEGLDEYHYGYYFWPEPSFESNDVRKLAYISQYAGKGGSKEESITDFDQHTIIWPKHHAGDQLGHHVDLSLVLGYE